MRRLVAVELDKLRTTRAGLALAGTFLALTGAGLALVVRNAGRLGAPSVGTADYAVAFLGAGANASLLLVVVGVLLWTSEHRHATLTATLLVVPDRRRVLAAKALTAVLLGFIGGAVSVVLALAVGIAQGTLGDLALNGEVLAGMTGRMLVLPGYALLGLGVGAVVRHQTAAVVLPLLWLLVLESLVPAYGLQELVPWLPGSAAAAMGREPSLAHGLPAWVGALVFAGYVAVLLGVGAWRLQRADVT